MILKKLVLISFLICFAQPAHGQSGDFDFREMSDRLADYYLLQDEHSLGFTLSQGTGVIRTSLFDPRSIRTIPAGALMMHISYLYSMPILRGVAVVLGSSAGYGWNTDRSVIYREGNTLDLPGLQGGLSFRVTPSFRTLFTMSAFNRRFEGIGLESTFFEQTAPEQIRDDGTPHRLYFSTLSTSVMLAFEFRWSTVWGMRGYYSNGATRFLRPLGASGTPLNFQFTQSEQVLGMGVTYAIF